MSRRDLRSAEAEWRNDPNRNARSRTPYVRPVRRHWLIRLIRRLLRADER